MRRLALVMMLVSVVGLLSCGKKDGVTNPQVLSWQKVTVDAAGVVGSFSSLALDAAGRPRIAYCDFYGPLKYAERSGAAWVVQIADTLAGALPAGGAAAASLVLDAAGNPRIAFQDQRTFDLRFAARNGNVWARETLDEAGNMGAFCSLALDADGHCHISYQDYTNGDLKYLTWTGTTYLIETVDFTTGTSAGQHTSIALDAQGNPHISYSSDGKLRYAARSGGGAWLGEEVPGASVEGFGTSLALDAGGNPRIGFQDGNRLKYASKGGAAWTIETVDATATVGDYCSLALDAQGEPHFAYHDITHGDLKYAVKSGGTWTLETVDEGNASGGASHDVGKYATLALDAAGNPRIAYYDATTWDLKYAEWGLH